MKLTFSLLLSGLMLISLAPVRGEVYDQFGIMPPEAPAKPVPSLSVLQCLKGIHDPEAIPLIIVRAKETTVPSAEIPASEIPSTLDQIQTKFHLMRRRIGTAAALVPVKMTEFSLVFPPIDPYSDLTPVQAFQLLAASLDSGQWTALVSESGLGYDSLTTGGQRHFWDICFHVPDKMVIRKMPENESQVKAMLADPGTDVTDKVHSLRLKLHRSVRLYLVSKEGRAIQPDQSPKPRYGIMTEDLQETYLHELDPFVESPNTQKPSDLDYKDTRLDRKINVPRRTTVGQLIAKLAAASGLRLYCSAAYEAYSVSVIDGQSAIRCGDILQSVALALTGTVRHVGRDYVLTNDRIGYGTKAAMLAEYEEHVNVSKSTPLEAAGDKLMAAHPPESLPLVGESGDETSPVDLTDSQKKIEVTDPYGRIESGFTAFKLDFSQLSPEQLTNLKMRYTSNFGPGALKGDVKSTGFTAYVMTGFGLSVMVPGVEGELLQPELQLNGMYSSSRNRTKGRAKGQQTTFKDPYDSRNSTPIVSFPAIVTKLPDRAIIVSSNSEAETLELLTLAKKMGFNHLWLDVFANSSGNADAKRGARQLLAAVLAGKKLAVQVSPVIDVLHSQDETMTRAFDITIRGETAVEQAQRAQKWYTESGLEPNVAITKDDVNALSPVNPASWNRVRSITSALSSTTGIPSPVLVGAGMAGYNGSFFTGNEDYGYVLPNRVGFLEKSRIDPIDLCAYSDDPTTDKLPLFSFSNPDSYSNLKEKWTNFRYDKLNRYLRLVKLTCGTGSEPILVEDVGGEIDGWYGSWDSITAPPPYKHVIYDMEPGAAHYPEDDSVQARMQSKSAYAKINIWSGSDLFAITYQANKILLRRRWKAAALNLDPNLYYDKQVNGTSLDMMRSLEKELTDSERPAHQTKAKN